MENITNLAKKKLNSEEFLEYTQNLKQYGLVDSDIKDPRTNKLFSNGLIIRIDGKENEMGLNNITYEVDSKDIENCESVYGVFMSDIVEV
ncbi:MAG: hypothetical protein J6R61_03690, partial [Bacteroidales bacterium]|nr:hypothetical protein [Bacteroidales bacterium]